MIRDFEVKMMQDPAHFFQIYFIIVILMPRNLQDLCPIWQVSLHNTIGTSALRLRSPPSSSTATGTLSMPSTAGLGPADQHKVLYIVVHRSINIFDADSLQAARGCRD